MFSHDIYFIYSLIFRVCFMGLITSVNLPFCHFFSFVFLYQFSPSVFRCLLFLYPLSLCYQVFFFTYLYIHFKSTYLSVSISTINPCRHYTPVLCFFFIRLCLQHFFRTSTAIFYLSTCLYLSLGFENLALLSPGQRH